MAPSARKLIFLDVDGTFVAEGKHEPPPSAELAVRQAQAAGHLVAVCSGRCMAELAPMLRYGFDAVIASAGGYVEHAGQVLYDHPMPAALLAQARAAFAANGLAIILECKDYCYAQRGFFFPHRVSGPVTNSEMARLRRQMEDALNIRPLEEYRGQPVYKVCFAGFDGAALQAPDVQALQEHFNLVLHTPHADGPINGEIINRDFSKGTAVRLLCQHLGVPLADTIAFGDSMNDYEMLDTAALGVCMGNGSEALKAVADEVCGTVEEDGLYRAFAAHGLV